MENIKTLQDKKKNLCSFNGSYNQIYEETKKETNYPIQSSQAIIKRNIHVSFGHEIISRLQKKKVSTP